MVIGMTTYRIVRIEQQPCSHNKAILHVIAVATGNPAIYDHVWNAEQVMTATRQGEDFYTQTRDARGPESITCGQCPECGLVHVMINRFDGPTNIFSPHW